MKARAKTKPVPSGDRVVVHLRSGKLWKGYLIRFSPKDGSVAVRLESESTGKPSEARFSDLKAIYYVRSLTGDRRSTRKRYFQKSPRRGDRVMVRFKDGEILCGYTGEKFPWKKGFLAAADPGSNGFSIFPADPQDNNLKIFISNEAVEDIRRL